MKPAARAWEEDDAERFRSEGVVRGSAAPTCFDYHAAGTRALLHGDDFLVAGPRALAECFRCKIREWYDVNVRAMLGHREGGRLSYCRLGEADSLLQGSVGGRSGRAVVQDDLERLNDESNGLSAPVVREDEARGRSSIRRTRRRIGAQRRELITWGAAGRTCSSP